MARFSNPFSQYFSDSGRILPGAQLFFYVNGTTTPQATYADAAFTVTNPNPVICGTNGRVPDIYMPGNLVYSITLTDTNGVQIDQADDITGTDSRVSSSDVIDALAANTDPVVINGSSATINADTTIDGTLDTTDTTTVTKSGGGDALIVQADTANTNMLITSYTGAGADLGKFRLFQSAGRVRIGSLNDAQNAGGTAFDVNWDAAQNITSLVVPRLDPTGDIFMANGQGIDFSAAGGDVLDQYDNWSFFTPVIADALSGGNTGTGSLNGRWAQIGDIVHVNISCENINTAGMTGGNTLIVRNLPVTVANDTIASYGSAITQSVTLTEDYWVSYAVPNNAALFVRGNRTGTTLQNMTVADLTSGAADLFLSIRYRAA